ncbi:hypothetical protein [Demequina sp. NBRC 110057]|uniref:hypothetical protein n=1 Tax=Demequina sp. NBRC 110057 TaxID=1570346 RepID=UPI000A042F1B|nr:hypothetical protein [Demequina sp. NBRC 110057]
MKAPVEGDLGYTLILPAGWVMLPTGDGAAAAIKSLAATLSAEAPRDERRARADRLTRALQPLIDDARAAHARDVVIPISQPWVVPASVSITIATTPLAPGLDAADLDTDATRRGQTSTMLTPAGTALREVVSPSSEPDGSVRRVVTYTWVPRDGLGVIATLVIGATAFEGVQDIVSALQDLGETVMGSIAWTTATARPEGRDAS